MSDIAEPLLPRELVTTDSGPFLAAAELTQRDTRVTAPHSHARGQLVGALDGLLSIELGDQQWVVPAVHAIWIPPHRVHALRSFGPFSGWGVFVAQGRCTALPNEPRALRVSGLLREAVRRAATWTGAELDAARTRLAEVIVDEIVAAPPAALGLVRPADSRIARIADALIADLANTWRLEQWAAWAGVAPRTMSRLFIAQTGMTFAQWRQRARVMRAMEQLAAGVQVTTVALDLGYENVSAFIDMFRRETGATPGRYAAGA